MATTILELDPVFRQALKFLHSPNSDAAENIRKALDDVIKQKHGPHKMLINTLSKKYIAEESKATGSGVVKPVSTRRSSNKSSNSSSSSPVQILATTNTASTTTVITTDLSGQTQEIPVIISMPDTSTTTSITAVDDNAMDANIHNSMFDDLACVICRRIDLSAKNRLIECTKCTSLYHQECHSPQIKDSDLANGQESSWCCCNCRVKKFKTSSSLTGSPSKSNVSSPPTSSNSSNSDVIITGTSSATFGSHTSSSSKKSKDKDRERDKEHSSSSSKSKSSSSRHHSSSHHHHSSSSSSSSSHHSSKHERSSEKSAEKNSSSSSSSSKSSVTPNIHIISADKRLQNMKKKAAKSQETKRKK